MSSRVATKFGAVLGRNRARSSWRFVEELDVVPRRNRRPRGSLPVEVHTEGELAARGRRGRFAVLEAPPVAMGARVTKCRANCNKGTSLLESPLLWIMLSEAGGAPRIMVIDIRACNTGCSRGWRGCPHSSTIALTCSRARTNLNRAWEPRFRLLFPHPTLTVNERLDEHLGRLEDWLVREDGAHDVPSTVNQAIAAVEASVWTDLRALIERLPVDEFAVLLMVDTNALIDSPDLASYTDVLGKRYMARTCCQSCSARSTI